MYTMLYPANGFDWFCMRYKLWDSDLEWRSDLDAEYAEDTLGCYDYLIVLDQTEETEVILAPYIGTTNHVGGYRISWEDELVLEPDT